MAEEDESKKALAIGKAALDAGDFPKAVRMFEKSIRLKKSVEAEALLGAAKAGVERAARKAGASTSSSSSSANGGRPLSPNSEAGRGAGSETPGVSGEVRNYTEEQDQRCKQILRAKTHYEVLLLERTATTEEIRRSYKRLALAAHPDKNPHPKADEAFKKVSKAFKVLSDEQERAHYDRYGDEDAQLGGAGGGGGGARGFGRGGGFHHHGHRHPDDLDPNEIFRAFFGEDFFVNGGFGAGGGLGGGGIRFRHVNMGGGMGGRGGGGGGGAQRRRQGGGDEVPPPPSLLQLFSFLVMFWFLFSSFSSDRLFSSSPSASNTYGGNRMRPFSLQQEHLFQVPRRTQMTGIVPNIPYFVDAKFASTYGRNSQHLWYVESDVETAYGELLKDRCARERTSKQEALARARGNEPELKKAMALTTPTCDEEVAFNKIRKKR